MEQLYAPMIASDLVQEQTHPLPRSGTDLIAFEPSLFRDTLTGRYPGIGCVGRQKVVYKKLGPKKTSGADLPQDRRPHLISRSPKEN